jgi:hypothetical protein
MFAKDERQEFVNDCKVFSTGGLSYRLISALVWNERFVLWLLTEVDGASISV